MANWQIPSYLIDFEHSSTKQAISILKTLIEGREDKNFSVELAQEEIKSYLFFLHNQVEYIRLLSKHDNIEIDISDLFVAENAPKNTLKKTSRLAKELKKSIEQVWNIKLEGELNQDQLLSPEYIAIRGATEIQAEIAEILKRREEHGNTNNINRKLYELIEFVILIFEKAGGFAIESFIGTDSKEKRKVVAELNKLVNLCYFEKQHYEADSLNKFTKRYIQSGREMKAECLEELNENL